MKTKHPRFAALQLARELVRELEPRCERLMVAGSLRRRKLEVGDVELLYIPKFREERAGLFDTEQVNEADLVLERLLNAGVLGKRLNARGSESWGQSNKLAVHRASGIPVDLFQARPANWWNLVVFRTGSAMMNTRICMAAIQQGWKWQPYGEGFLDREGNTVPVTCESDVFHLVGLPWLEAWER